ncbi:hypothetical protein JKA73_30785 [Myxococcus xanthus]|uniref:hypothetical protein n=1 Tax=Myxococcus xanthus TaxID=34 RepID=UPI0019174584|nr:hypothetical protein [Myxococcus xanthus]QQR43389.1 hypothetical protein JKA73_30785 [Myxococcus xanthus]
MMGVREATHPHSEVRRIVAEVQSWDRDLPASLHWGLGLPCITYEYWGTCEQRAVAKSIWSEIPEQDATMLQGAGLIPHELGYLGTAIIHLPQLRPFFFGIHHVVLPGGEQPWGKLRVMSEVLDGKIRLALNVADLVPEYRSKTEDDPLFEFVSVWFVGSTFAEINMMTQKVGSGHSPNAIARLPEDHHGVSHSDWRLTLIDSEGGHVDSTEVGTLGRSLSSEPWKESAPHLGFSAPASIIYLPPEGEPILAVAHDHLARVGSPALLCDPYLAAEALDRLTLNLKVQRVLAKRRGLDETRQLVEACRRSRIQLRFAGGLHDRFIIGPKSAYLLGTSLNGIGKKHSFLTAADNRIRLKLSDVFELLWSKAAEP